MGRKLNRRYRLEFGRALNLIDQELDQIQVFVPDRRLSVQSRILTEHRIQFDIDKTASASQNSSEIILTNISDEMWQFINGSVGQEVYLRLEAATNEDPLKVIAVGTISQIKDNFQGTDRLTKITFNDGYTPLKEKTSEVSYPANEPYQNIIAELASQLGLPFGVYQEPPIVVVSHAPWSFSGNTVDGLRRVAKELQMRFNVTDGTINLTQKNTRELSEVAEYSHRSGLIGEPVALDKSTGIKQGSSEEPTGISFTVLINGSLKVDSLVAIDSRQFRGIYRISKMKHKGDSRGNAWYTECEALLVSGKPNPVFRSFGVDVNEDILG